MSSASQSAKDGGTIMSKKKDLLNRKFSDHLVSYYMYEKMIFKHNYII